jgi:hypothetical protein
LSLYKANTGRRVWKGIGDGLLKLCYLNRDNHHQNIWIRKQRTDVDKYSFKNRTIRSWNQLHARLLASFLCKINMFRKKVKNGVTSNGIAVVTECE